MDEETIFHLALEKLQNERSSFLEEACGGDADLRQRVEVLLRAHENPASFLEPRTAGLQPDPSLDPPILLLPPGTVIGRYKLLGPIGEGGYGTVFMAEQTTPVQRRVALKIIKAGMDTRQVIARFEAERQALALMDHPNIAKVFDAGVTDTGRPYFVMELVKGVPITKYCDQHRLEPRQRLELFMQVCRAVQHAHQKGIIHRDLKPNNVLVAQYDGRPVPKVIDFGVAKATGQQLTDLTMFTGFGDVIGTLEYMSPEQAKVNQLDVDTRSDIYSLGVLLYELLTGSTPLEHTRVLKAGLLEMLRVVREEEPPKPSARITTSAELPSIAACRGIEPRKLSGLMKGELDWIAMKALEKDRTRRYETADGFARDVGRYLSHQPVEACLPSRMYRLRKFARRNRTALLTTTLVTVALFVAVAVSGWMLAQASAHKRRAEELAAIGVLSRVFEAAVSREAGDRARAESLYLEAIRGRRRLLGEVHPDTVVAIHRLARMYRAQQRYDEAVVVYRQLLAVQRRVHGNVHHDVARALNGLASTLYDRGRFAEAEPLMREALQIDLQVAPAEDLTLPNTKRLLGYILLRQRKYDEAEPLLLQSLAELAALSHQRARTDDAHNKIVQLYEEWGKPEAAREWRAKLLPNSLPPSAKAEERLQVSEREPTTKPRSK